MRGVLNQWSQFARQEIDSFTESEIAALAEFALSGPGVVLGRALYRFDKTCLQNSRYFNLLDASWNGLRSYLNRSLFLAALTRRGQKYTKAIPEAVVAGNLESVLDEHLWVTSRLDADAIGRFCVNLRKVLGLHDGRHQVHEPGADGFHLRCHAAMPFADAKVTSATHNGEDRLRTDDLRHAFNSPFWPHVLATTSMGQEGLDYAANALGLSDQVPAKIVILTDGVPRRVSLGKLTLLFRRASPRNLFGAGKPAGLVIQAIRHLRNDPDISRHIARLKKRLDARTKLDLKSLVPKMPVWMRPILQQMIWA